MGLRAGSTFCVGSLPHRSVAEALDFAWSATDIPTIFTLPRHSPAEGMIAQALVGIEGVSMGQYGGISVDISAHHASPEITTDLSIAAYASFAAFFDSFAARGRGTTHVKWQFVGPVTLGVALMRAGLDATVAFDLAQEAVRGHLVALEDEVRRACGDVTQIIVLDEPSLPTALEADFPVGPERIVDVVSGALAAVPPMHTNGLHCCARTDWGAMLATGANIISVPVPAPSDERDMADLVAAASRISDHVAHGGRIAWGAVRTDGPISTNADRSWKRLLEVMCALVRAGVDPLDIRTMSHITPACGLGTLSEKVAARVMTNVHDVSHRLAQQATASRLTLGS